MQFESVGNTAIGAPYSISEGGIAPQFLGAIGPDGVTNGPIECNDWPDRIYLLVRAFVFALRAALGLLAFKDFSYSAHPPAGGATVSASPIAASNGIGIFSGGSRLVFMVGV